MANAARVHVVERGKDPRGLPLFAFGGAGPVHGFRVAQALGSPALIAPFGAGVTQHGRLPGRAAGVRLRALVAGAGSTTSTGSASTRCWPRWRRRAQALLRRVRRRRPTITHTRAADMRYVGQGHEIRVPLPAEPLTPTRRLRAAFETEYRRLYGRLGPRVPLEAINWRVRRVRPAADAATCARRRGERRGDGAQGRAPRPTSRSGGGYVATPVYDRYRLAPGARVRRARRSSRSASPRWSSAAGAQRRRRRRDWNLVVAGGR